MILALSLVFVLGIAIAYANGANDVSKGIATLVGSGVTSYRRAVAWGTLWTGVGGIAGAFLARAMVHTFGKGLLSPGIHATVTAAIATIAGAALWVALATQKGLPVSTTHAIVGSIAGVASAAYGLAGVNWVAFGGKIALPLILSPLVSLALTSVVLRTWKVLAPAAEADCVCVEVLQPAAAWANPAGSIPVGGLPQVHLATCVANGNTSRGVTLDQLHWLTSGAASFSRSLNDAPKMVALVLGAALLSGRSFNLPVIYFVAVTFGMLAGSWLAGRRVTDVLANKVTPMSHREGFVANLVTAALVGPGAALGLPMSTTHVSSGAIMGVAAAQDEGANNKDHPRYVPRMAGHPPGSSSARAHGFRRAASGRSAMSRNGRLRVAGLISVIAALGLAAWLLPLKHWIALLFAWVRGFGTAGALVYALVYVGGTILLIPGTALTAGAGLLYGPFVGVLIVSPASVIGATFAFLIGRHFARAWVERKLATYPKFSAIDRAIQKSGFKVVLLLRFQPVFIPFAFLNYALGLTSVRLRDYVLASWLGMLPASILYVYLGSAVHNIGDLLEGKLPEAGIWGHLLFWGGLAAVFVLVLVLGRIARKALHEQLGPAATTQRSIA